MKFRGWFGYFSFYFVPIFLLFYAKIYFDFNLFSFWGEIAEKILIFILFIKPIAVIFNSHILLSKMNYRKEIGVISFWFSAFHVAGIIYINNYPLSDYLNPTFGMFWGVLSIIGMTILAITSNRFSMIKLNQNWKKVQMLAYPTLLLVLLHSSIATNNITKFYILGSLFIILKGIEFWLVKKRKEKELLTQH